MPAPAPTGLDTYPRQSARTRRFSLGAPRDIRVGADGSRVTYLRSAKGDDPVNRLWVLALDAGSGKTREWRVPVPVLDDGLDTTDLPAAEQARRERARESGSGIVAYDADAALSRAAFALGGRLFVADLDGSAAREWPSSGEVFDPRLSPDGTKVAYVSGRTLRISDGAVDRIVIGEDTGPNSSTTVSWGSAEFVAAEEMNRSRGFWWSPDGSRLAVARVDVAPVSIWWIASPVTPWEAPRPVRYPAAGAANADVRLAIVELRSNGGNSGGRPVEIDWRLGDFEYLADVIWPADRADLTLVVQSRDQRTLAVLRVDVRSGKATEIQHLTDDSWVELVPGSPAWLGDRLLTVIDRQDTRRLCLDGASLTPIGLQVRRLVHVGADHVVVAATDEPTELHLYRIGLDASIERLTHARGVHAGAFGGSTSVITSTTLAGPGTYTVVRRAGEYVATITTLAELPLVNPSPTFLRIGERELRTAVLLPTGADPNDKLPVLLDPYGGPHALRVQASANAFATSQWFADEGFAVIVADGRGTPARGAAWERSVRGDLATYALEDQVAALEGVADQYPQLDLSRVAIRGWSFGGYLAALAVLRRPDVFHAAVAGAPVTDWRLYDTHYTERYLGHPSEEPGSYARNDLTAMAASLERPLLLVHGLADDNVVAAHTLALSRALLEAGRPHRVLPLSGVTHMTPQEVVAENLLRFELAFLRESLRVEPSSRYQWRPMLPRR
jgi:dipeptidyl-peptidase-4